MIAVRLLMAVRITGIQAVHRGDGSSSFFVGSPIGRFPFWLTHNWSIVRCSSISLRIADRGVPPSGRLPEREDQAMDRTGVSLTRRNHSVRRNRSGELVHYFEYLP